MCFLSTTFPNAPAHPPPILFDQSLKGAKLDTKIGLYFTHQNNPIFRAKTDLSDLQCTPAISGAKCL